MGRARSMLLACLLPLGLAPAALTGCYRYTYPPATPAPSRYIALDLNDRGRVALEHHVGPSIARVEGTLDGATDSVLTLRVVRTISLRGQSSRWNGESVTIRREHVGVLRERHFSPGRTVALAGSMAAGVGAFILTRDLFGFGGSSSGRGPTDPPGGT
jgi:hypothetical protein